MSLLSRQELEAMVLRINEQLELFRDYVEDPGNWSALDGRRAHLLGLLGGA